MNKKTEFQKYESIFAKMKPLTRDMKEAITKPKKKRSEKK